MIEVEFEHDGQLVLIRMSKGLLVMDRSVFIAALKRGKGYRCRTALEARLSAQLGDNEFHQAPQAIKHASVANVRHERFPEPEATTHDGKVPPIRPAQFTMGGRQGSGTLGAADQDPVSPRPEIAWGKDHVRRADWSAHDEATKAINAPVLNFHTA